MPILATAVVLVFLFAVFLLAKYYKVTFKESLEAIFCCRCYGIYYLKHLEPSSGHKNGHEDGIIYDYDYQIQEQPPMANVLESPLPTYVQQPQATTERDLELDMILYGDKYVNT